MLDASIYTLTNGALSGQNRNDGALKASGSPAIRGDLQIEDSRFHFQEEGQLPKPRQFTGAIKRYRAGRGSSVPLDLARFR